MVVLTAHKKNKHAIYRWRSKNKEKYLMGYLLIYKKMQDPEGNYNMNKLNKVNLKRTRNWKYSKETLLVNLESIILI